MAAKSQLLKKKISGVRLLGVQAGSGTAWPMRPTVAYAGFQLRLEKQEVDRAWDTPLSEVRLRGGNSTVD